jgi:hypothetical protein
MNTIYSSQVYKNKTLWYPISPNIYEELCNRLFILFYQDLVLFNKAFFFLLFFQVSVNLTWYQSPLGEGHKLINNKGIKINESNKMWLLINELDGSCTFIK